MAQCRFRPLGAFDIGSDVTGRSSDNSFLFVFLLHLPSILYHSDVIGVFLVAENGGKPISAVRGRVRPQMKSPFNSLTPIWYRSVLEFSALFHLSKVIRLFRFACKMPFEIFYEGISSIKKIHR
jgi:hypothetical protein